MAEPIERGIKSQYARIFEKKDWQIFKSVTEYYFSKAAKLRIKDIEFATNQLLLRNIQKRLFLGIGGELLVKAYFLKSGYYINRPLGKGHNSKLIKFTELDRDKIDQGDTFSFNELLDNVNKIEGLQNWSTIQRALKILKVFRNKEGHVVTSKHNYDQSTYDQIEEGIIQMFREAFSQAITFKIAMRPNENGIFKRVVESNARRQQ